MFINPQEVIKNGWLKFPEWMNEAQQKKCIQPNAIDFTADKVFTINMNSTCLIDEDNKVMRGGRPVNAIPYHGNSRLHWKFNPGEAYDVVSDFYVTVPEKVAVILFTRSTFIRNGMFWTSGLYDSGYKGHIGGVIHNNSGVALIFKGTRIGQIAFVQSDSAGVYAGGWNHAEGTHAEKK